ncbi:LLM class flavin-dependent oxidoreductase [Micromonospora sp. WMMD1102]|uniref:LLM class flavin-dependent oxidoreductase n=1 Tax=Micromonospora sp. WMMD1102 TaxID=3016105 RepID=UPI002414E76C|nr:LLM class flavin-dependent oxidoreductase [Micromonospora sp. WMMD1102]MDG4785066.1 LLM class flavin-dependent oxidoreductase [Micromonospora sp. WMMD1102]
MTADPSGDARPSRPRVDLFLLAAQFPGADHTAALGHAVDYAIAAETAGFDGVWLAEHHFISYGVCPSAVALAGFLLGRTNRLRVGTAAAILPNRHPVALAEEAALLDAVSGGRFDLGVARGGPWVDLEVFGTGLDRSTSGFPESLDLLLTALSGRPTVTGSGPVHRFRQVAMVPRPSRPLPVWLAATSTPTVDLAAARGLPLLLGMHVDDAAKAATLDRHARTATAAGRNATGAEHVSAHLAYVADTVAEAEKELRDTLPGWLARTREYVRIDGSPPAHRDLDAYLEHLLAIQPVGPADRCVSRLAGTLAATGARRLMLTVEAAGHPDRTLGNIRRLGAEVLPHLAVTG